MLTDSSQVSASEKAVITKQPMKFVSVHTDTIFLALQKILKKQKLNLSEKQNLVKSIIIKLNSRKEKVNTNSMFTSMNGFRSNAVTLEKKKLSVFKQTSTIYPKNCVIPLFTRLKPSIWMQSLKTYNRANMRN